MEDESDLELVAAEVALGHGREEQRPLRLGGVHDLGAGLGDRGLGLVCASGEAGDAVDGRRVAGIVLTHGHNDHINAAVALRDAVDAPVGAAPEEAPPPEVAPSEDDKDTTGSNGVLSQALGP